MVLMDCEMVLKSAIVDNLINYKDMKKVSSKVESPKLQEAAVAQAQAAKEPDAPDVPPSLLRKVSPVRPARDRVNPSLSLDRHNCASGRVQPAAESRQRHQEKAHSQGKLQGSRPPSDKRGGRPARREQGATEGQLGCRVAGSLCLVKARARRHFNVREAQPRRGRPPTAY